MLLSIGRNEPCPCGSEKKFKKCCGKNGSKYFSKKDPINDYSIISKKEIVWPDYSYNEQMTTPANEFEMSDDGIRYIGKGELVRVPEELNGQRVTAVAEKGFAGSKVQEVYLPPTLEVIGDQGFDQCKSLERITFPPSLKKIGRWAFQGCTKLKTVYMYDGLEVLDGYAFDGCHQLEAVRLPSEINYIGAFAFSETALEQVILPAGIEFLGNCIFSECARLERVFFQEGLQHIGSMAFMNCISLQAVHFPNSLQGIRSGAFGGCIRLEEVLVQENIKTVAGDAFYGCGNIKKLIVSFKEDLKVELLDEGSQIGRLFGAPESPKEYEWLDAIILFTPLSRHRFIKPTYMEDTQSFTRSLLAEANKQYGLKMVLPWMEENDGPSDLEEFDIDMLEEDGEGSQTAITDRFVELLTEGVLCKRLGDVEGAKQKYIEAVHVKPTDPTAYYNLGKILYILQDYEASVRSYKTALELGYDYNETLRHLGHSLLDGKNTNAKYTTCIQHYLEGIHPYAKAKRLATGAGSTSAHATDIDAYETLCIQTAEALGNKLGDYDEN